MPDQIIPPPTVFDMAGALDMPAPAEIPDLPSPTPLPAPEYGAYGGQSTEDLLKSNLDKFKQSASQTFDYNSLIQPIRYDDPVYDRLQKSYEGQRGDLFNKLGFFPDINNEDRYARSLTKWQKLGVAMGMVGDLAKDTFVGQWETEADFWKNLSTGKFKQAFLPEYSNEDLLKLNASLESATNENYIPLSSAEQKGEYGFGKLATGIGQFGFTLGTIGAFGTQLALEMGAAALLAPMTEGLSLGVEALSFTNKIKRVFNLAEAYKNLSKFENGVEAANKIKTAYNYVKNTDNIKSGLGKFYGFTKQWNAAVGEAKFEAAGSYADYVNGERLKALQDNRIITYEEQQDMETKAANIAQHNNLTNIGLLFAMNKLNMNNVLRGGFGVQRRFMSEFGKTLEKDILKEGEKYISRFAVKATSKQGLLGMAKGLGGWTLDSAWEGVQEVAQGASGNYWKDYYVNSYDRKSAYDKLNLVGKTVSDKLKDNESFEEFISGFIIGVPGAAINRGMGGIINYGQRGQIKEYKKSVEEYVNKLNEFEKDPLRVFDPRVANLNNQTTFTKMMDDAVKKNDIYAYKNINKEALRDMVMLGIKTGKLDYMIDTLKNQVDTLEDDQFKEIFNISADSTSRKTAKDYVNLVEEEAGYIVKEYDKAKQKFPNPFANMKGIKAGSTEEVDQKIRQVAWEDAVQDLIFEHRNYADTVKRMSSILGDAKEFVGEALYNPFFTMTSSENIDKEINILKQEIDADKKAENKTKDVTDRIEAKQKQLDALKKWQKSHNLMSKPVGVGMFSESMARYTDEAKAAFGEVLNVFQDQGKASTLTTDSIDKAYNHIIDFMKLQNDNQTAVKNISFLSSPDGFKENYSARNELAKIFYDMEIARREGVVDKRTKILQALDTDSDFNNLPKVPGLGARLDASMQEREYDDVEDIMNELEDIYDEYTGVKKPEAEATTTEEDKEEVNTAPLSDIDKIKSKNAQLGESILQKLGFKIENRSPNGNVKGGQDGWKIRFNIKNSATGGSYYDDGKSTLIDDAYKDKVFKLVNFLNTYFDTEVSTGSLEKAEELTGKQGYHAFTKDKSNPSSIWKHLAGGEIGESDFTIYIGSADDVLKFISDVRTKHPEILELLHTGNQSGDILIDDIFKGRIEGADIGFSGYHVPTNLNKVIGSDDFIFVHNGRKVIISYTGKALTDITVISEETGKGYKGVFDENMKKDLPELYKNIRNIIGFQLYGKYLTGSNNEFVKLTGVKDADLADVRSRPAPSVGKSMIFKKYETKINNAFDKSTLDKLSLEISKNKIGLSEEDKKALLDLIQEKYNTIPSGNEAGMKVFQSYLDALKNITIDQTKTPKEQAADYNEKANSIINTAMADTRLYSSELPDDLVARLFNLANETERSILDGTYSQKKESNFDNVSKQIEEATTADELKKIKKMVDETFTGKELADLTKLIIDKLESMPADETNTDSYPVNETHDFSNVDEFNEDDFAEDINNIVNNNKEETGTEEDDKKNNEYDDVDDNFYGKFKSCNNPPTPDTPKK